MEHIVRSLKTVWRTERILGKNEFRLMVKKLQLNLLAGVVALFGLVMLSLALFFTLLPHWGQALSALAVGGLELVIAVVLIIYSGSLSAPVEMEMVREMRDMALQDVEEEVALAQAELVSLKQELHRFIRNPVDSLLPSLIGPLLSAVTRVLGANKK
jgi:hypothetical protein